MRHADAEEKKPRGHDISRNLSFYGRHQCEDMVDRLSTYLKDIDVVLCSTAQRSRQTLDFFLNILPKDVKVLYSEQLYSGSFQDICEEINLFATNKNVFLIGHNPNLNHLTPLIRESQQPIIFSPATTLVVKSKSKRPFLQKDFDFVDVLHAC